MGADLYLMRNVAGRVESGPELWNYAIEKADKHDILESLCQPFETVLSAYKDACRKYVDKEAESLLKDKESSDRLLAEEHYEDYAVSAAVSGVSYVDFKLQYPIPTTDDDVEFLRDSLQRHFDDIDVFVSECGPDANVYFEVG